MEQMDQGADERDTLAQALVEAQAVLSPYAVCAYTVAGTPCPYGCAV